MVSSLMHALVIKCVRYDDEARPKSLATILISCRSVGQQYVKLTSSPLQLLFQSLALEPQEAAHQDRDHQEQQQHNQPRMIRSGHQEFVYSSVVQRVVTLETRYRVQITHERGALNHSIGSNSTITIAS